jgi:hypothetical protein
MEASHPQAVPHKESPIGLWGRVSADNNHQFRFVRELGSQELSELDSAEQLIQQFTSGSPIERMSLCVEAYNAAYVHQERTPSEASLERVVACVAEFAQATSSVLERYSELATSSGNEAVGPGESPDVSAPIDAYPDLSELNALLNLTLEDKSAKWELSPMGLIGHIGPRPTKISELMLAILNKTEVLFLWEVNRSATALDTACRFLRLLTAEVLQGVPLIMPVSPDPGAITPRQLEIDSANYVQVLRRHAESVGVVNQESAKRPDPEAVIPDTPSGPQPRPGAAEPRQSTAGEPVPRAEPALGDLVGQLTSGLEDFLTSWSLALEKTDVVKDQAALKGAVAAIGSAVLRELSKDEESDTLLLGYPLDPDSVTKLDASSSGGQLALGGLGRVLITKQMMMAADSVASIRTLEVRGDTVRATSFHPGVVENALSLAWTLASCVETDDRNASDLWLSLAVQAHAWGMYEAAILYALFALNATKASHPLQLLARQLLDLTENGDHSPSRACFAPIAGQLIMDLTHEMTDGRD